MPGVNEPKGYLHYGVNRSKLGPFSNIENIFLCFKKTSLRGVYTGEKTLHIVAVASDGDLKRCDFNRNPSIEIASLGEIARSKWRV